MTFFQLGGTTSGTMNAPEPCASMQRHAVRSPLTGGAAQGDYPTHNAGVAGSSPAPAIAQAAVPHGDTRLVASPVPTCGTTSGTNGEIRPPRQREKRGGERSQSDVSLGDARAGSAVTALGVRWRLSSSSDRAALAVVDGTGPFDGHGPHYSRRTPGARTFTGCGQEIVLVSSCGRAVWAVVYQRTPSARGTGSSRGRESQPDARVRYVWRNMLFRNLGAGLSSELIREATAATYAAWPAKYGALPREQLRTEVDVRRVQSTNPGYCYLRAGWTRGEVRRGKLHLYAPGAEVCDA